MKKDEKNYKMTKETSFQQICKWDEVNDAVEK